MRPKLSVQEQNRLMNVYSREARERGLVGPYRIAEYAAARLKGKTVDQATKIAGRTK